MLPFVKFFYLDLPKSTIGFIIYLSRYQGSFGREAKIIMKDFVLVLDMDNTILRSNIDFVLMQELVGIQLREFGRLPANWQGLTTAQIIEEAKNRGMTFEEAKDVWYTVGEVERLGMADAIAEYGARDALVRLKERFLLIVLTNNANKAAEEALDRTDLLPLLDRVMAREEMGKLKPEPDGLLKLRAEYSQIAPNKWLFVGDSWVDGLAAMRVQMPFALYEGHRKENWQERDIPVLFQFDDWQEIEAKLAACAFGI